LLLLCCCFTAALLLLHLLAGGRVDLAAEHYEHFLFGSVISPPINNSSRMKATSNLLVSNALLRLYAGAIKALAGAIKAPFRRY
jgi:hypothetical protein